MTGVETETESVGAALVDAIPGDGVLVHAGEAIVSFGPAAPPRVATSDEGQAAVEPEQWIDRDERSSYPVAVAACRSGAGTPGTGLETREGCSCPRS